MKPLSATWKKAILFYVGGLCLVLFVARLNALPQRRLIHYDEGYYLLETRALREGLSALPGLLRHQTSVSALRDRIQPEGAIFPPGIAKPTYAAFLTLFLPPGLPWDVGEIALCFLSSLFVCWALYALCRHAGIGHWESALGAALLFLSPVFGYYSMSGFSHTLASLLFLLAVIAFVKEQVSLAGFYSGVAFTIHYASLPQCGLLGLAVAIEAYSQSRDNVRLVMKKLALFAFWMLLPIAAWEVVYRLGKQVIGSNMATFPYRTYWEQIQRQLGFAQRPSHVLNNLLHNVQIFYHIARTQGLFSFVLWIASCGYLLARPRLLSRKQWLCLGILIGTTLFWFLNLRLFLPRLFSQFIPLFLFALALAIHQFLKRNETRGSLVGIIILFIATTSGMGALRINRLLKSPYHDAVQFLQKQGYTGQVIDQLQWPIWQYYLGQRMLFRPETTSTYELLRTHVQETLRTMPPSRPALPLFVMNQEVIDADSTGRLQSFFSRLFQRPPDHTWEMPYSRTSLYQDESAVKRKQDILNLYWVTAADFNVQ